MNLINFLKKNSQLIATIAAIATILALVFSYPTYSIFIISILTIILAYVNRKNILFLMSGYYKYLILWISSNFFVVKIILFLIIVTVLSVFVLKKVIYNGPFAEFDLVVSEKLKGQSSHMLTEPADRLTDIIWDAAIKNDIQTVGNGLLRLTFIEYLQNTIDIENAINSSLLARFLTQDIDIPKWIPDKQFYAMLNSTWDEKKSQFINSIEDSAIIVFSTDRKNASKIIQNLHETQFEITSNYAIKTKLSLLPVAYPKGKYSKFLVDIFAIISNANFIIGIDSDQMIHITSTFPIRRKWIGCHLPELLMPLSKFTSNDVEFENFLLFEEKHQQAFNYFYSGQVGKALNHIQELLDFDTLPIESRIQLTTLLCFSNILLQDEKSFFENFSKFNSFKNNPSYSYLEVLLRLLSTIAFENKYFPQMAKYTLKNQLERKVSQSKIFLAKQESDIIDMIYSLFINVEMAAESSLNLMDLMNPYLDISSHTDKPKVGNITVPLYGKEHGIQEVMNILSSEIAIQRPDITLLPRIYLIDHIGDPSLQKKLIEGIIHDFFSDQCRYLRGNSVQWLFPLLIEKFYHVYSQKEWQKIFDFTIEQGLEALEKDAPYASLVYTFGIYTSLLSVSTNHENSAKTEEKISKSIESRFPEFSDLMNITYLFISDFFQQPNKFSLKFEKFVNFLRYFSNRNFQTVKDHRIAATLQFLINLKALYDKDNNLVLESNKAVLKHLNKLTDPDSLEVFHWILKSFMESQAAYYYKADNDVSQAYSTASQKSIETWLAKLVYPTKIDSANLKVEHQELKKMAIIVHNLIFIGFEYLNDEKNSYQFASSLLANLIDNQLVVEEININRIEEIFLYSSYILIADYIIYISIKEDLLRDNDPIISHANRLSKMLTTSIKGKENKLFQNIFECIELMQNDIWYLSNYVSGEDFDDTHKKRILNQFIVILDNIYNLFETEHSYKNVLILGPKKDIDLFLAAIQWQLKEVITNFKDVISKPVFDVEITVDAVIKKILSIIEEQIRFVNRHDDKETRIFLKIEKMLLHETEENYLQAIKECQGLIELVKFDSTITLGKIFWLVQLANLNIQNKNFRAADTLYQRCIELSKDNKQGQKSFFLPLVVCKIGQGDFENAINYLNEIIEHRLSDEVFWESSYSTMFTFNITPKSILSFSYTVNTSFLSNSLSSLGFQLQTHQYFDRPKDKLDFKYFVESSTSNQYDIILCSMLIKTFLFLNKDKRLSATNELEKILWYISNYNPQLTEIDLNYLKIIALYANLKGLQKLSSDIYVVLDKKGRESKSDDLINITSEIPTPLNLISGLNIFKDHYRYIYMLARADSIIDNEGLIYQENPLGPDLLASNDWANFIANYLLKKLEYEFTPLNLQHTQTAFKYLEESYKLNDNIFWSDKKFRLNKIRVEQEDVYTSEDVLMIAENLMGNGLRWECLNILSADSKNLFTRFVERTGSEFWSPYLIEEKSPFIVDLIVSQQYGEVAKVFNSLLRESEGDSLQILPNRVIVLWLLAGLLNDSIESKYKIIYSAYNYCVHPGQRSAINVIVKIIQATLLDSSSKSKALLINSLTDINPYFLPDWINNYRNKALEILYTNRLDDIKENSQKILDDIKNELLISIFESEAYRLTNLGRFDEFQKLINAIKRILPHNEENSLLMIKLFLLLAEILDSQHKHQESLNNIQMAYDIYQNGKDFDQNIIKSIFILKAQNALLRNDKQGFLDSIEYYKSIISTDKSSSDLSNLHNLMARYYASENNHEKVINETVQSIIALQNDKESVEQTVSKRLKSIDILSYSLSEHNDPTKSLTLLLNQEQNSKVRKKIEELILLHSIKRNHNDKDKLLDIYKNMFESNLFGNRESEILEDSKVLFVSLQNNMDFSFHLEVLDLYEQILLGKGYREISQSVLIEKCKLYIENNRIDDARRAIDSLYEIRYYEQKSKFQKDLLLLKLKIELKKGNWHKSKALLTDYLSNAGKVWENISFEEINETINFAETEFLYNGRYKDFADVLMNFSNKYINIKNLEVNLAVNNKLNGYSDYNSSNNLTYLSRVISLSLRLNKYNIAVESIQKMVNNLVVMNSPDFAMKMIENYEQQASTEYRSFFNYQKLEMLIGYKQDYFNAKEYCENLLNADPDNDSIREYYFISLLLLQDFQSGLRFLNIPEGDPLTETSSIVEYVYGFFANHWNRNYNGMQIYRNIIVSCFDLDSKVRYGGSTRQYRFQLLIQRLSQEYEDKLSREIAYTLVNFNCTVKNRTECRESLINYLNGELENSALLQLESGN